MYIKDSRLLLLNKGALLITSVLYPIEFLVRGTVLHYSRISRPLLVLYLLFITHVAVFPKPLWLPVFKLLHYIYWHYLHIVLLSDILLACVYSTQ